MTLNSDAQGFLIGSPVDLGGLREEMRGLRRDVQSIRQALRDRKNHESSAPPVATPKLSAAPAESAQPSARRRTTAEVLPNIPRTVAEPSRGRRREVALPSVRGIEPNNSESRWNSGPGVTGRVARATTEVAKSVVNDDADASVKAFNEVAEPLKRGWTALRGDRGEKRQEGWLKRIFGALKDRASAVFGRDNESAGRGNGRGVESRFDNAMARAAEGGETGSHGATAMGSGWGNSGREISLHSIEGYLKSIDGKVRKPKGDGLLGMLMSVVRVIPAMVELISTLRMHTNLDRIEGWSKKQFEISEPFFAYARKRLKEMGEVEEDAGKGGGGIFATIIAATLGAAFAKLAGLLSGIPLIGPAIASLARLLGGRIPMVVPRGAAAGSGALVPAGAVEAAPKWGKTADGVRGNRAARTGRVVMRNAGRALRPAGAMLKRLPVIGSLLALGLGIAGSSSIEKDESTTRDQKNAKQGKNWGGVAGGLSGAAAGAALGTVILPGIGTVIGGVLGAVLGEWLGGNLGEMLGEKFSVFMAPVSAVFQEIKFWALGTWDWIRDGATQFFDGTAEVFAGVGEWIGEKWTGLVDAVNSMFDAFVGMLNTVLGALRDVPVIGPAIRAAEAAAQKAAEVARAAADKAAKVAGSVADVAADTAGKVADGAVAMADKAADWASNTNLGKKISTRQHWESAKSDIVSAANGAGIDPGIMAKIAGFESRFDATAKASSSSAHGYGQFIDGTWTDTLNRHGAKYKVPGAGKLTKAEALEYRGNPKLQAQMLAELTKENIEKGRKAGGKDDDANVYAFHNLGDGDAAKFLRGLRQNPNATVNSVLSAKVIKNNPSLYDGGRGTLAQAYSRMGEAMRRNDWAAEDARSAPSFAGVTAEVSRAPAVTIPIPSPPATPVYVTPRAPAPPPLMPAPVVPESPQMQVPLGSGGAAKPVVVKMEQPDAGQDVRDRGIAHIATGGLARV